MHNYVPHVQRAHFWRIRRLLSLSLSLFLLSIPLGSFTSHQSIAYGQASDLFFSEYIEGSSNNKAIEIYNGTGTNINLSTYSVEIYNNGASTPNNTEALSGTLIDGDVLVIANSSAAGAILTKADLTSSVTFFNGDDALVLKNNGVVIDMLGVVGTDPGSAWGGGGTTTQDQTIRRLPTICAGDPDGFDNPADISDEWEGFAQDTFDGLGSHTANCNGDPPPPPPDPTTPQILITEIMYNPASAENDWEWVEIYNAGSQTVDLAGYVLDDINSVVVSGSNISAGTIDPGASALLFNIDAITAADFAAAWGAGINLIPVTQWNTLSLNNSGDQVGLWDTVASYTNDNQTHANTIITVNYATSGVWPSADGAGSIYLTDLSLDSSNGNSWALSTVGASTPVFTAYQSNPSGGNSGSDIGSPGMPSAAPTPSLLLTEIVVTPTGGEFVEIYNPNSTAVDLSNVYLTDATFAGGGTFYYNIVTGANAGGGGFADFHARFPDGASIAPDTYQTIALAGSSAFVAEYGIAPTYELFDDGSTNGEQQMREALPGSTNNQGGLSNGGEVVILYTWDGASDLVQDLDYAVWGDKAEAVDKTGVAIDGPDADSATSTYLSDTAISSQDVIAGDAHLFGNSWQRNDLTEGAEMQTGGNGASGSDETSEDLSNTWCDAAPTPRVIARQTVVKLASVVIRQP